MFATIFIPTGNRAKSLNRVLSSLTKQTFKDFEVIVVDYQSTDNTHSIVKSYKNKLNIRLVHQHDKGLANASNLALRHAKGDIFIRTDDDVVMGTGWLNSIRDTFMRYPRVGGVTGPTVMPKKHRKHRDLFLYERMFRTGGLLWRGIGALYFKYFMEGTPRKVGHWFDSGAFSLGSNFEESVHEPVQEVTNLEPCNFAVRTLLLKKIGGFDTVYGGVGEYYEADAAFKIIALGYRLMYNPQVYLNHCPSQEGVYKERPESYSRMVNFVIFYLRHIKPNSTRKFARFISYLLFLNCYYLYTAIRLRQPARFGALPGTVAGMIKYHSRST